MFRWRRGDTRAGYIVIPCGYVVCSVVVLMVSGVALTWMLVF